MERQTGRSGAVCRSVARGVLGQGSLSAYGSVRWLKVWRGGGCKFQRDGTSIRRNGGQVDAEWRLPSLVTTSGVQRKQACGVEIPISMKRKWEKTNNQPKTPPKPLEETIAGQRLIFFEAFSRAVDRARGKTSDEPKFSAC